MRRLRKAGSIPAILYGRGQESIALTLAANEVGAVMRHGSQIVELVGDVSESALVKFVQWDALGSDVLHLDLARIDVTEDIEVNIAIELRGIAPGSKQGGSVQQVAHEIAIVCPANKLPDSCEISINALELNQSITAGEIDLPAEVKLVTPVDDVIVTCFEVIQVEEEEPADFASAEPEVIGRTGEEEETEGGDG